MSGRWAKVLCLGLVLCFAAGCGDSAARGSPSPGVAIESDDGGDIVDWFLTVASGMRTSFLPTLADIIRQASPDVRFHVFYSGEDPGPELLRELGKTGFRDFGRIRWIPVGSSVSPWTRDFFVAGRGTDGAPVAMLHDPEHYQIVQGPVQGRGEDLRSALRSGLSCRTVDTRAHLEGGAVVADERHVFITPAVCEFSVRKGGFRDWADFIAYLRKLYGRPVVVLDVPRDGPWEHADLFLTPVGADTILLGDPVYAARLVDGPPQEQLAGFARHLASLAPATPGFPGLARADAVRVQDWIRRGPGPGVEPVLRQLWLLGYRVDPLPWLTLRLPGAGGEFRLSYNNVILERHRGRHTVYLPKYGLPALDRAARETWERHGFRVVEIEALGPALYGGSVRCLSQVFRR